VLGPLRVTKDDGNRLDVGSLKMGVVLATLLIRANQVVPVGQMVTEVWGERPPRRATAALYVYISQLRKLLTGSAGGTGPIVTSAPGYVLHIGADELDLRVFQCLADEGREAMREARYERARSAFTRALGLWRGPALRELRDAPSINSFVIWMEEIRLECTELLVEANLELNHHREQISVLRQLIMDQPLHEPFYRQLMLALYRSERRADALAVYQDARATLQQELGLEPGRGLREVQQSILYSNDDCYLRRVV
jgi:SARP family transcriptional regulator, regulator of embCAB operon